MTIKELFEHSARTGLLPRVSYHGPQDRYLRPGAEGIVRTINSTLGGFIEVGVYFPRATNWTTWFQDDATEKHDGRRKYLCDLKIILP